MAFATPLALLLAAIVVAQPAAAQTASPQQPVRVGGNIPPPVKTKDVKPVYPPEAQAGRISGVVVLEVTIGSDGRVQDARVVRSIPLLDAAALSAVRQWEFTPTIVGGTASPVVMVVTVAFNLDASAPIRPPLPAPRPSAGAIVLTTANGQDGARSVFEITIDRAAAQPRWVPLGATEPPLTIATAEKAAETWLLAGSPEVATLVLSGVSLFRTAARSLGQPPPECWYYRLTFDRMVDGQRVFGGADLTAVVLLDGSIVEPRRESAAAASVAAPPAAAPTPPAAGPDADGVYAAGNGVTFPRPLRNLKPQYTPEAMQRKIQGTVLIEVLVNPDGTPANPRIIRSLDPEYGLDNEAIRTVMQSRFNPGTRQGVPVPVRVTVEMTFTLR
jgi:TonB family protein